MARKYTPRPHSTSRKRTAPRPFERRAGNQFPYYRLAKFSPNSLAFMDDPAPIESIEELLQEAFKKEGRYRITRIEASGPELGATFAVTSDQVLTYRRYLAQSPVLAREYCLGHFTADPEVAKV